jgi:hypothetical protein
VERELLVETVARLVTAGARTEGDPR